MKHAMTEAEMDRVRVEIVFGLGGGELEPFGSWSEGGGGGPEYWFEGTPRECGMDLPLPAGFDEYDGSEYRCIIHVDVPYGLPETPRGWERIAEWAGFSEADCWCCDSGPDSADPDCQICEGEGHVYTGTGALEVVRKAPSELDVVELARAAASEAASGYLSELGTSPDLAAVRVHAPSIAQRAASLAVATVLLAQSELAADG